MNKLIQKVMLAGFIVVSSQLLAESYDLKLGLWETTSKTEILAIEAPPDIEKMIRGVSNIPQNTEIECIKNIDSLFASEPDAEQCKWKMKRVSANKIAFEGICGSSDGSSKGVGEMHLKGETFTAWFEMTSSEGGINIKMKTVANGKYIGACK